MERTVAVALTPPQVSENVRFMSRVYAWMTVGIAITGLVALLIGQDREWVDEIYSSQFRFGVLVGLQLSAVVFLSISVETNKIRSWAATLVYALYAMLVGVTLSVVFVMFTLESVVAVFGLTSFAFAGLSAFGLLTKKDLGPVGSFCTMGLFGYLGLAIMFRLFPNVFSQSSDLVLNLIGIVVFSGLTAYDTQKIKALNVLGNEGTDMDRKEAIVGALTLYLDFINLFVNFLKIFGKRR